MLIILFLSYFSFSEQTLFPGLFPPVCQQKPESLDEVAAQLFAIGDPCHSFPTDKAKAADLCAKYRNWTTEVDGQLTPYLIRKNITSMYNFTAQEICRLYEQNTSQMIEVAKELNSKSTSLYSIRQNILDTYYITQTFSVGLPCRTLFGTSMISCLMYKWFNGVIVLLSPPAKVIGLQVIKIYMKFAAGFNPLPFCMNLPPRLTDTEFTSIDMNFLYSTNICFDGL